MSTKKTNKKTSQKQIEANRRNSKYSTGPKTKRGKSMSKNNATKYGFLAKELLNSSAISKEEKEEFRGYLREIFTHENPVGPIEKGLLRRYAVNQFRLLRVIRAENGELERSIQIVKGKFFGDNVEPYLDEDEFIQIRNYDSWENVPATQLEKLAGLAAKIAAAIETTGKVHSTTISELSRGLAIVKGNSEDGNENGQALKEMMKRAKITPTNSKARWDEEVKSLEICVDEDVREEMVGMLRGIKEAFLATAAFRMIEEMPAIQAKLLRVSVPDSNRITILMKVEAALENGAYKALHEFQRLQAIRLKQTVAVPTAIDVTATVSS